MLKTLLTLIFGSKNDQFIRKVQPKVDAINALEESYQALSDDALRNKTSEFKERLKNEDLESILVEAFAVNCGKSKEP